MNYREIGIRIQLAREEASLNQKELADMMGLSQSTLSNYEKGKRKLYLAQLQSLARILGKPLDFFLRPIDGGPDLVEGLEAGEGRSLDELLEVISILRDLPSSERKSVYDYAKWLKARRNEE
jgi:transcriptional regulator with XRE-family HTH domain